MKITNSSQSKITDLTLIIIAEKSVKNVGTWADKNTQTKLQKEIKQWDFEGKKDTTQTIQNRVSTKGTEVLWGAGEIKDKGDVRKALGRAVRFAKSLKKKKITVVLPDNFCIHRSISGLILGDYEFKVGDTKDQISVAEAHIVSKSTLDKAEIQQQISLAEAANYTRESVNLPSNLMTPSIMAQWAKDLGKGIKKPLKVKILKSKEIKKLGMGAMYNVGKGSKEEPHLIVIEYWGTGKKEAPTALVGKGVCFDTGGYNIKQTGHMEDMMCDMAGAGTVLGVMKYLAETKPKKNVIGIIGAVENMISSDAYKPGDILTAMNGKTIQVGNTDAEGRLVLADCLHYANVKYKPAQIFDFATLTGACIVALGFDITGIMGNNQKLIKTVQKSSDMTEEPVWELPLNASMLDKTKGSISDLTNYSKGAMAGSSMAGAFLQNFVGETPWVHFDIAGTAFHEGASDLNPIGATGTIVRTVCNMIEHGD